MSKVIESKPTISGIEDTKPSGVVGSDRLINKVFNNTILGLVLESVPTMRGRVSIFDDVTVPVPGAASGQPYGLLLAILQP